MKILLVLYLYLVSLQGFAAVQPSNIPPTPSVPQPTLVLQNTSIPSSNLVFNSKEFKEYFKISGENTTNVGNHIDFLLAFIAFVTLIATLMGFGLVRRNQSLHESLMALQNEIKEKVQFSVDIAVAQEIAKRSDDLYEYSQNKLSHLQTNLYQQILAVEVITNSTKKITDERLCDLSAEEIMEVKETLLELLSCDDIKIDNSLVKLHPKIAGEEWVFLRELMKDFFDDVVLINSCFQSSSSMSFKSRLEEIKALL